MATYLRVFPTLDTLPPTGYSTHRLRRILREGHGRHLAKQAKGRSRRMPGYRVAMWCSQPVPQHLVSELSPHRPHLFPTTVWTSSRPSSTTGHVDATTYLVLKNRSFQHPPALLKRKRYLPFDDHSLVEILSLPLVSEEDDLGDGPTLKSADFD